MRNGIVTICFALSCVAVAAQDSLALRYDSINPIISTVPSEIVYRDTMDATDLTITTHSDDALLLEMVSKQSQLLAARRDSLHHARLLYDTTTLMPLHLGYADSLSIASKLSEQGYRSPLCLPLLYLLPEKRHFAALNYSFITPKCDGPTLDYHIPESYSFPWMLVRRFITTQHADLYVGMQSDIRPTKVYVNSQQDDIEMVAVKSLVRDSEEDRKDLLRRMKQERSPWYKEATVLLQFTQNYVSPNWYEGGNSALSLYSHATGLVKYDDKKRINWETTAEWRAGLTTVSGDSLRKINCSEDLLRVYSKLGVKMIDKLYGSVSAEFRTQLLPTYKANTMELKTYLFSPIRFNLALGVDVKPIKGLSIVISPVAYKMVYAFDTIRTTPSSFGIEDGNMLNDVGSSVRLEWKWKPIREFQLETKLYSYTNYKMFEADLEMTFDFILNRFFTIRGVLHPRYDSSLIAEGDTKAKFQFKELLSIGFAHKFH